MLFQGRNKIATYNLEFDESIGGEKVRVFAEYDQIKDQIAVHKMVGEDGVIRRIDGHDHPEILRIVEAAFIAAMNLSPLSEDN